MNAYLVRTARGNADLNKGTAVAAFKNPDMAVCRFPGRACGMNTLKNRVWNLADRSVDVELVKRRIAGDQGKIKFQDPTGAPRLRHY